MEKKSYESPEFGFQEMKLMERVAEKCWGHGYAWVDHEADPNTPPENYYFSPSGCAGYDDQNRLNSLIQKYPILAGKVNIADVKVNTKDSTYIDFPDKSN